jgi:hypothetical protein
VKGIISRFAKIENLRQKSVLVYSKSQDKKVTFPIGAALMNLA